MLVQAQVYWCLSLTALHDALGGAAEGAVCRDRQVWLQGNHAHLGHRQLQLAGTLLNGRSRISTVAVQACQLQDARAWEGLGKVGRHRWGEGVGVGKKGRHSWVGLCLLSYATVQHAKKHHGERYAPCLGPGGGCERTSPVSSTSPHQPTAPNAGGNALGAHCWAKAPVVKATMNRAEHKLRASMVASGAFLSGLANTTASI